MNANSLRAIFLRKGEEGLYTKAKNIIPGYVLSDTISDKDIIVSYYKNDEEWLALTDSLLLFKNDFYMDLIKLKYTDIENVHPFPFGVDPNFTMSKSEDFIFLKTKTGNVYNLKVESGRPRNGILQLLHHAI
ncbi:hypothetical protein HB364_26905 [Pseudoflavitalea sp. X16]|uniref:hypothetical protein n=1 Tax=Paraflavitalea devenefica TaxID=2716334 RepID=UPI00141EF43A|nr:hypothetical protein [Paraflavitalea devenefica]NII28740.1 hypothetical protein [Paraflavitalea devenefica]